ncbi:hypothetical protein FRB94_010889 [Tulasnella sp. JGI-2019a]|nr:hypothetical protein FRB93_009716 [Tulasnella sp. JGI-2019a]KAG9010190.1 hypothetical protein FRB94_010889 [Tulasnella sp. JGI-2019a]KAG9035622.1 hypothetical protein FRB95_011028 [Tulasnella sp. JGI-2019a]
MVSFIFLLSITNLFATGALSARIPRQHKVVARSNISNPESRDVHMAVKKRLTGSKGKFCSHKSTNATSTGSAVATIASEPTTSTINPPPQTTTVAAIKLEPTTTTHKVTPVTPKTTTSAAAAATQASTSTSDSATSGGLTSQQISDFLTLHNTIRAQHGASALTWDATMANAGEGWADKCVFEHSGGSLGPWGENIAAGTGSAYDVTAAMKSWTDEISEYDAGNPVASHYTQVVWKGSQKVGCGLAPACAGIFDSSFGPAKFFVCEYSPAGNVIGEFAQNVQ